jgi:D-xylose transport system substrate-binding protein
VKIVLKQYHPGWSPKAAMETTENVLTQNKNDIQAILANNSGMAHGAVQALEEQKLTGKVFVAGADADLAAIQNIVAGKQQFEVQISIQEMAKKAAEVAVALAQGKPITGDSKVNNGLKDVVTFNTPVYGIDSSQVESRIIKTGFHPREAVYSKKAKK